ncbi:MAG: 16S rRNA (guanine(966)-N(2))-methyltransferase RsmD [Pseudomonadota bacterium]
MRIIAGRFRGRPLTGLGKGDAAAHLRPTSDRVREALFSMIGARRDLEGLRVLDLFAGTGALGLEALSRGAAHATFVESGRKAQRLIAANLALLGVSEAALLACEAARLPPADAPCDLVFLDPPYDKGLGLPALQRARAQGWIAREALVVWEEVSPQRAEGFTALISRRYGDTVITLLEPIQP